MANYPILSHYGPKGSKIPLPAILDGGKQNIL